MSCTEQFNMLCGVHFLFNIELYLLSTIGREALLSSYVKRLNEQPPLRRRFISLNLVRRTALRKVTTQFFLAFG